MQTAQRASLWRGMVRGALKAVQTASLGGYKAGLEAGERGGVWGGLVAAGLLALFVLQDLGTARAPTVLQ